MFDDIVKWSQKPNVERIGFAITVIGLIVLAWLAC